MANEVVLDRTKPPNDETSASRIACLCCGDEHVAAGPDDNGTVSNEVNGFKNCWLCGDCYKGVKDFGKGSGRKFGALKGSADSDAIRLEQENDITNSVMKKLGSYADVLVDKIVGRLEMNGSLDMSRGSSMGERSFADVVRKPAAKIVISNAGDSFIKDASDALKETPVSFMKADKAGNVTIALPDEDTLNSARGRLRDVIPNTANTKTVVKLPKVTVCDFPLQGVASGELDRREMDCEIINRICMKNREVKAWIDEGHTCEVVYVGRSRGRDRASVGLRVSCTIRDFLLGRGNLFVGNVSCRVEERNYIPQCYMCQRFGHKAFECEQDAPTCMHCAEAHPSRDCENRRNTCCANCKRSSDPHIQRGAAHHNAASFDCPVYIRRLRMQKN